MPPPLPLDAPLPSRRSQHLTQPPQPNKKPLASSNMLNKRVLTVDEFQKERLIRARINPPPPPLRGIPVPLHPGETQQQYTYKFTRWLAKRNESLEALHNDPKRERKLWLTFAFHRVQTPTTKTENPRGYKRNIDEEYEAFYQRSATQEIKRLKRDKSMENDRSPPRGRSPAPSFNESRASSAASSHHRGDFTEEEMKHATRLRSTSRPIDRSDDYLSSFELVSRIPRHRSSSPPSYSPRGDTDQPSHSRNRTEILAPRVLSVEDYISEMKGPKQNRRKDGKLAKIPVPLFPGETMDDYEQEFGRWLHHRQTSVLSLRYKPLKERVYRHQFAQQRVMEKTRSDRPPPNTCLDFSHLKQKGDIDEAHKVSRTFIRGKIKHNSSTNTPHSSVPSNSSKEFVETTSKTESSSHHPTCAISRTKYNSSNQKRNIDKESSHRTTSPPISSQALSSKPIQDIQVHNPTRSPQVPLTAPGSISSTIAEKPSTHPLHISDDVDMPKSEVPTQDELPIWALQLISRVHELETKVVDLQQIIDDCRSTCCRCCPSDSHQERADPGSKTTVQITVQSTDNCIDVDGNNNYKATQGEHVVQRMNNLKEELPDKVPLPMAKRAMVHTNEDIHRNATRNLARAIQSRIQEDPKKQQLTEAYDYLNKQITMNETAIEDALDYIKAIKSVDEAMAVEQHGQIMELVVSINKEKERRESALAALIFYNFAEKQDTLRSLLNEEILGVRRSEASHEKLGTIFSRIEEKDSVLETLETHLNEQLQWVTGIPSDVSEVDKTLRFKALRKLSNRLSKEQAAKEQLEREREDVLLCFIQGDKAIRKLIQESLAKNNKPSQSV